MRRPLHRGAFSLIELLVVIAIISLLMGLMLSAVQKVREAAARLKCANNTKQLALALHQYHDAYGAFPPGCSWRNGADPQPHMSWLTRLLPWIEQEALWREALRAFEQEKFFVRPPHGPIYSRVIPLFVCPSDFDTQEPQDVGHYYKMAFTNYLGVWGTDYTRRDGILFLDSRTRIVDIRDGTTNTIMIGERPPSTDYLLGWWYAGWGQARDGSCEYLMGARELNNYAQYVGICPPGPYHYAPGHVENPCDTFHFWSYHAGGCNFALADGSVRFLSYSVDPILPALATRAGREVASVPD